MLQVFWPLRGICSVFLPHIWLQDIMVTAAASDQKTDWEGPFILMKMCVVAWIEHPRPCSLFFSSASTCTPKPPQCTDRYCIVL
ncbi:hypothetical protein B9Z19DRAFT_1073776 [Tuber borchii]|uniref:Secreted protein n=1 Tax=Tuber borchii TaxID=42251 RepID=A0A2T7A5Q5_TUBBO|nr:hypothetical protein B9Z19DRAFT_1073776 [Tuber borchii]